MEPKFKLIQLPIVHDRRGNLTFIENSRHIPFDIQRVYYLYDVPQGSERGGHAHKTLQQFLVAAAGSFDVHVDDGENRQSFHLNRASFGLYLPNMTWRTIDNFSSCSVCLVMASNIYLEEDYHRDYGEFRAALKS